MRQPPPKEREPLPRPMEDALGEFKDFIDGQMDGGAKTHWTSETGWCTERQAYQVFASFMRPLLEKAFEEAYSVSDDEWDKFFRKRK